MNRSESGALAPFLPLPESIVSLIRRNALFIFLDYDGTLTPIVSKPSSAQILPSQKELIKNISVCPNVRVAVVSGRSLSDIKEKMGIHPLIYMGNHGLEYEGPFMKHVHPDAADFKDTIAEIEGKLREVFKDLEGILVEDKTFTLSVHYRMLDENKVVRARELIYSVIAPYLNSRKVMIRQGKKVWEVRPLIEWDKGKMVMWTLARFTARFPAKIVPIYFGDDDTDEDAFRVLRRKGITVRITKNPDEPSSAEYYLGSPEEVYQVLSMIKSARENED